MKTLVLSALLILNSAYAYHDVGRDDLTEASLVVRCSDNLEGRIREPRLTIAGYRDTYVQFVVGKAKGLSAYFWQNNLVIEQKASRKTKRIILGQTSNDVMRALQNRLAKVCTAENRSWQTASIGMTASSGTIMETRKAGRDCRIQVTDTGSDFMPIPSGVNRVCFDRYEVKLVASDGTVIILPGQFQTK